MSDLDFGYSFPAIRGIQAEREYYVTMCPLRMIPRIFCFDEETDVPPLIRAQRALNQNRIPEMARYIVNNNSNYVFSAITASLDADVSFQALGEQGEGKKLGVLKIPMDAKFIINDGQHRRAAIIEALKERPELGNETISVVFFMDRGLKRCQQMFADLNRYAIRPSASLSLLYDHRDTTAELTRRIIQNSQVFFNIVELEKSSLSKRSKKLFTLSAIHHATGALLHKVPDLTVEDSESIANEFWNIIFEAIPEWNMVSQGRIASGEIRQQYIHVHGVVLHAFGMVGNSLILENGLDALQKLSGLSNIDLSRQNTKDWEGRALIAGRLIKSQNNIILTSNLIKKKLNIKLSVEHQKVEDAFLNGGK